MNKNEMTRLKVFLFDFIFSILLLAFDQFTKYLSIQKLKGEQPYVLIDGVLELQYLENRGSAFGLFQGQKVMLLTVGIIFMLAIMFLLLKIPLQKRYSLLRILFCSVIAGGIGNMIDRFRFDFVVDFISFVLINYPIFNVADIYVVLACIGLLVLFLFVYSDEELEFFSFRKSK